MNRFRTLAVIVALVLAAAGTSLALGAAPVSFLSDSDEPDPALNDSAEPSPEPTDDVEEADEEDADEAPENEAEDVDPSPEPEHTDEPEESAEPEPTDGVHDEPEAHEGEGHEGGEEVGDDHHEPGTIVSFDAESGLLTVEGSTGQRSGVVTSGTELEWESSGEGPGECNGSHIATTEDLVPGTRVSELSFVDDEHLGEVELICPTDDGDGPTEEDGEGAE